MTVTPITLFGHPALRSNAAPVVPGDPDLPALVRDLSDTLADFRQRTTWGRAISANQIGVAKRVIVMNLGAGPRAIINPVITWRATDTFELWDDCFSLPDVLVRVRRPTSITVEFVDEHFTPQRLEHLDPSVTELLAHEIDHLDGVLMLDRATDPRLVIARTMRDIAATELPAA